MGLLKGSVTFSRYRIVGALPDHFPEFFNERIRRYAFQTVWRTTDEKAAGWTSVENVLDTDFPYASYAQGRYMLFSLRIDRKSVPPSLLRLRILEAERKHLADNGQKKLYREQREASRGVRAGHVGARCGEPHPGRQDDAQRNRLLALLLGLSLHLLLQSLGEGFYVVG